MVSTSGPSTVPDAMPVLSRGRHRSPRRGACFMEMASVLAGETWSDKPSCTHPLLAHLARLVNDHSSDAHRSELAVLIPSVVGLRGDGLAWSVSLTTAVAAHALLEVPEPAQKALAAGLLRCEELCDALGSDAPAARERIRTALEQVPAAAAWARQFLDGKPLSRKQFESRSAPAVMRCAVRGVVMSAVPDPDAQLRELLRTGIAAVQDLRSDAGRATLTTGSPTAVTSRPAVPTTPA